MGPKTLYCLFKSGVEKTWTVPSGEIADTIVNGRPAWVFVGRLPGQLVDTPWTVYQDGVDAHTIT